MQDGHGHAADRVVVPLHVVPRLGVVPEPQRVLAVEGGATGPAAEAGDGIGAVQVVEVAEETARLLGGGQSEKEPEESNWKKKSRWNRDISIVMVVSGKVHENDGDWRTIRDGELHETLHTAPAVAGNFNWTQAMRIRL